MADLIFNVAKGRLAYYSDLPGATDSLIVVPLLTAGIVADATMKDYTTLDAILSGASDEQTTMGRKTLASVTSTVDQAGDKWWSDAADATWTGATGGAISALVVCYKPDSAAADSAIIPLAKYDFVITPNGGDITAQVNALGLYDAA